MQQTDAVCAILSTALSVALHSLPLWLIPLLAVLMERVGHLHCWDAGEEMHACALPRIMLCTCLGISSV